MARKITGLTTATAASLTDITVAHQGSEDKQLTLQQIYDLFEPLFLEAAYPVGTVYTQLPGKDDPETLGLPGTWTNVSSTYAGEFFRAEGGNASTFESGEQSDAFQGHYHQIYRSGSLWSNNVTGGSPYTHFDNVNSAAVLGTNPGREAITDSTNGTPRTDSETRPVNVTIRLWERTE